MPAVPQWIRRGRIPRELTEPLVEDGRRWERAILPGGPGVRLRGAPGVWCVFPTIEERERALVALRRVRVRPESVEI